MASSAPTRGLLDRWVVLLAAALFLLAVPAGLMGLLEPGETRVAEIAREMRAGGDWWVPRLDGLVQLARPPLAAWATGAGLAALGEAAWGARLPAALAAVATLLFTVAAARRRFAALLPRPTLPAWLMLGSLLFATAGRLVSPDPFLAAAVTGWWALAPSPWAAALLGLGLLARGPWVLAPTVLAVVAAAAWRRERAPLALLGPAWGWLVFAAVALPWPVAMLVRWPSALGTLLALPGGVRDGAGAPPWYLPGVLIAGLLPWTPALLAGAFHAWRERTGEARLVLAWLLVPLVLGALLGTDTPAVLLAVLPAAAMLAALGFERSGRAVRHATGLLLLVMAGAAWIAARHLLGRLVGLEPPEAFRIPVGTWLALAALVLAAFRVVDGPPARTALLVAVGLTAGVVSLARYDRALGSARAVVAVLRENRGAAEPVVAYRRFVAGLPFHLGGPVLLLEAPLDSRYDDAARVARTVITRESLAPLADAHGRVWVCGPAGATDSLVHGQGLRWTRIATWKDLAVGFASR